MVQSKSLRKALKASQAAATARARAVSSGAPARCIPLACRGARIRLTCGRRDCWLFCDADGVAPRPRAVPRPTGRVLCHLQQRLAVTKRGFSP